VNIPQLVLSIAAHGNLSVAEGLDGTIYVWGDYFGQCITTPFRTTFSRIHDPFAYNSCRVMHKPLTVSTNVYEYAKEVLKIVESLGTGFDDPVRFVFFCMYFFVLYVIKLIYIFLSLYTYFLNLYNYYKKI